MASQVADFWVPKETLLVIDNVINTYLFQLAPVFLVKVFRPIKPQGVQEIFGSGLILSEICHILVMSHFGSSYAVLG